MLKAYIDRVNQSFDEALSVPENARFVPQLRAMQDAFRNPSNEMIAELESIGRLRDQARNALSDIVKQYSTDGDDASKRGTNASGLGG